MERNHFLRLHAVSYLESDAHNVLREHFEMRHISRCNGMHAIWIEL